MYSRFLVSAHECSAFGPLLKPNVCVLLDVGTKPTGTSIYEVSCLSPLRVGVKLTFQLYKCFEKHPNVGGACGEIYADTGQQSHPSGRGQS